METAVLYNLFRQYDIHEVLPKIQEYVDEFKYEREGMGREIKRIKHEIQKINAIKHVLLDMEKRLYQCITIFNCNDELERAIEIQENKLAVEENWLNNLGIRHGSDNEINNIKTEIKSLSGKIKLNVEKNHERICKLRKSNEPNSIYSKWKKISPQYTLLHFNPSFKVHKYVIL